MYYCPFNGVDRNRWIKADLPESDDLDIAYLARIWCLANPDQTRFTVNLRPGTKELYFGDPAAATAFADEFHPDLFAVEVTNAEAVMPDRERHVFLSDTEFLVETIQLLRSTEDASAVV